MNNQRGIHIVQILLGVLMGVILTLTVVRYRENRHRLDTQYKDWRKLNLILEVLEQNYVDTLDVNSMTDAAVVAALASLDPHSIYLPPVNLEESEEELSGNFDGIGIQFNVPNDTAIVLEVIAGGPSERAGLQPGDRLLKVDDLVIAGVNYPQDSMVRHIKGPSGTKVMITVARGREIIPFEITRGRIPTHSVDAYFMMDDGVGYLRLAKFSRTTFEEFQTAALELKANGMNHLILDLRDNNGGYMDQALLICNQFLNRGDTLVYIEGLHRRKEVYRCDGRGALRETGITVLISENSASASEIVAGAIQDNDRGSVVGRRSFGKGLVQEPFYFNDGSGLRITVARYYTPSGRCIQKPYVDEYDYAYDIYRRYADGEVFSADSIKVDTTDVHHTRGGRTVYGGGGIIPDVFVPVDTTRATRFFIDCNRKTTQMRFASWMFDRYRNRLLPIDSYAEMDRFFASVNLPDAFRDYALRTDGLRAGDAEWRETEPYLLPQLKALIARYSRLGENAFYKYYLPVDNTVEVALETIN